MADPNPWMVIATMKTIIRQLLEKGVLSPANVEAMRRARAAKEAQQFQAAMAARDKQAADAVILDVQRWMFTQYMADLIGDMDVQGPERWRVSAEWQLIDTDTDRPAYGLMLEILGAQASRLAMVRQALQQLPVIDGVDAVVAAQLKAQKSEALRHSRLMFESEEEAAWNRFRDPGLSKKATFKEILLDFLADFESHLLKVLLLRAWGRAFGDFQYGLQAALVRLIHDMVVQQQASSPRMRFMQVLYSETHDLEPLRKHYRARFHQLRAEG